jgi:hypothetical protein
MFHSLMLDALSPQVYGRDHPALHFRRLTEFAILIKRPHAMPDHSVHKATDLASDERLLIERWLGRPLSSDETISVNAYRPHSAPTGDQAEILWHDILTQAREIGSRAPGISENDLDALLGEALAAARGGRE